MRSNLIMLSDGDLHYSLPYVMIDLMDDISEPEFDTLDLDMMIEFMSVLYDLRALRSWATKAFALIDAKQSAAVAEWLQWIREFKGSDGDLENIDLTLSYWTN